MKKPLLMILCAAISAVGYKAFANDVFPLLNLHCQTYKVPCEGLKIGACQQRFSGQLKNHTTPSLDTFFFEGDGEYYVRVETAQGKPNNIEFGEDKIVMRWRSRDFHKWIAISRKDGSYFLATYADDMMVKTASIGHCSEPANQF